MKNTLQASHLSEDERMALAALADGPASAQELQELLGLAHFVRANKLIGSAAHKIYDAASDKSVVHAWRAQGRADRWYHIVAPGWISAVDGRFYFELRSEIREALVDLGWYVPIQGNDGEIRTREAKFEGAEVLRLISTRERDPWLRQECLRIHGVRCVICAIDLGERYGELGKDLIHVHHLTPLASKIGRRRTDPAKDLVPVCPNCHSVIHRGGRLLSPDEVRAVLSGNKTKPLPLA